jgi:hypothetical protein
MAVLTGIEMPQELAGINTAVALPESSGQQTRIERFAPMTPEEARSFGGGLGGGAFSVRPR